MKYQTAFGLQYINYLTHKEVYCPGTRKSWAPSLLTNRICDNILLFGAEKPNSIDHICAKLYRDYPNQENKINLIVDSLVENGLLRKCTDIPLAQLNSAYHTWKKYNWLEPLTYHWHTNLYPKHDYTQEKEKQFDQQLMNQYFREEERPPVYKAYNDLVSIPLINKDQPELLPNSKVFSSNRSNPIDYRNERWSFKNFAAFCYLAFGETGKKKAKHYDFVKGEYKTICKEYSTRTYPSGGSRHPTEIYMIINNVESLEKGIYHYNVMHHAIELLETGDFEEWAKDKLLYPRKRVPFSPSLIIIYSTIFERSMFRYREPRSYRVMHYDLGHLMKNTSLIARAYSRNCYSGPSLPERYIEEILKLDGIKESVMAFSAIS